MEPSPLITFHGPYNLEPESANFLFAPKPSSWKGGLYVLAWKYDDKYFAHYIGETQRYLPYRVLEHLQGTCSGAYYLYNIQYLDQACARLGCKPSDVDKYLYGPPNAANFCGQFVSNLERGWGAEIAAYLKRLRFFLGPITDANKKNLLAIEAVLTHRAYGGPCKYVLDSPPKDLASVPEAMTRLRVEVDEGITLHGITTAADH